MPISNHNYMQAMAIVAVRATLLATSHKLAISFRLLTNSKTAAVTDSLATPAALFRALESNHHVAALQQQS